MYLHDDVTERDSRVRDGLLKAAKAMTRKRRYYDTEAKLEVHKTF
jgi:hypothetical protein